jgi:hypothetical protein
MCLYVNERSNMLLTVRDCCVLDDHIIRQDDPANIDDIDQALAADAEHVDVFF